MCPKFVRSLLPLLPAILIGCSDRLAGGSGAGNPPLAQVSLALTARSTLPTPVGKTGRFTSTIGTGPLSVKDLAKNPILLTGLVIQVDKIEFSLAESVDCGEAQGNTGCLDREFGLHGDFKLDLIQAASNPPIGIIKIPIGTYQKIVLNPIVADSLHGSERPRYNFLVLGKVGTLGSERNFAMEIDLEEGLEFEEPKGIPISNDSLIRLNLSLNVDNWFGNVDLPACLDGVLADSTGTFRLSEGGACGEVVQRVGDNLQESEDAPQEGDFDE